MLQALKGCKQQVSEKAAPIEEGATKCHQMMLLEKKQVKGKKKVTGATPERLHVYSPFRVNNTYI